MYNALGISLAAGLLHPFTGALLSPMIEAPGHQLEFGLGHYQCIALERSKT